MGVVLRERTVTVADNGLLQLAVAIAWAVRLRQHDALLQLPRQFCGYSHKEVIATKRRLWAGVTIQCASRGESLVRNE